jgi:hypothetical protein
VQNFKIINTSIQTISRLLIYMLFMFTITSCDEYIKCNANDNTARPTIPDKYGRNIGDNELYKDSIKTPKDHTKVNMPDKPVPDSTQ